MNIFKKIIYNTSLYCYITFPYFLNQYTFIFLLIINFHIVIWYIILIIMYFLIFPLQTAPIYFCKFWARWPVKTIENWWCKEYSNIILVSPYRLIYLYFIVRQVLITSSEIWHMIFSVIYSFILYSLRLGTFPGHVGGCSEYNERRTG